MGDRDAAGDYRGVVCGKVQHTIEVGVWPLSFIRGVSVYTNALGALGGAVSGLGTTERAGANGRACLKQMQPKLSTVIAP